MESGNQSSLENPRSHYNRFLNSQRKIKVHQSNENLTARVHPKYPRNAEVGIQKAVNIDKEIAKGNTNDTPSPNKYKKSTIFDHDDSEANAKGYRGTNIENINRIINNNTQFRIFNQIRPRDGKVAPLENLNLNPNKWQPKLTYYYQENRGDVMNPNNNIADADYYNPMTTKSKRESRLLNSKRQLQEYLDNVKSDPIYSIQNIREKLNSKSVLNKLPAHDRSVYATPEIARNGPTNKTLARLARNFIDVNKSNDLGMKNPAPGYPVLDIQKRIIKDHQTDINKLRSRKYGTINISDRNYNPNLTKSPEVVHTNLIVSPTNPRPVDFINNVSKLEVSGPIDKIGGITYRGKNSQTINPVSVWLCFCSDPKL